MAIGPNRLKGSSTLYEVKSGPVKVIVNLEDAVKGRVCFPYSSGMFFVLTFNIYFYKIKIFVDIFFSFLFNEFFVFLSSFVVRLFKHLNQSCFILKEKSISRFASYIKIPRVLQIFLKEFRWYLEY